MADKTKVTRIKATDDTPKATKQRAAKAKTAEVVESKKAKSPKKSTVPTETVERKKNVFARIGAYFKGAWIELKQVRWPTRKATWGLTIAVLLFSLFFVVLILLLDTLFNYVFQQIIT